MSLHDVATLFGRCASCNSSIGRASSSSLSPQFIPSLHGQGEVSNGAVAGLQLPPQGVGSDVILAWNLHTMLQLWDLPAASGPSQLMNENAGLLQLLVSNLASRCAAPLNHWCRPNLSSLISVDQVWEGKNLSRIFVDICKILKGFECRVNLAAKAPMQL